LLDMAPAFAKTVPNADGRAGRAGATVDEPGAD
jgi:hypothetical protein